MKVCYTGGAVKDCGSYYSVATNAVELRIWFLTDDILRIRAGFDGDWDEASYSLTMTAWESRTDELMKDCRKRVQSAAAALTDGDRQAVIQGARLKVVIEKAPFRIMVYDKDGSLLHADIPDLAYREDSNHRRIHASQIEADDCFYGFGEKSGEINKAEKYMNMAPGDAMGYNAKETDSLYKHIPFYIRLNRGTKQAVGYFYHNTAECDFNMGREKRNYWHRYSSYRTDAGDIDLFLIAGPSIREIIEALYRPDRQERHAAEGRAGLPWQLDVLPRAAREQRRCRAGLHRHDPRGRHPCRRLPAVQRLLRR